MPSHEFIKRGVAIIIVTFWHLPFPNTASTFAKPITNRSSGFYNACFVAVRIALCIYLYVCVVVQSHANKIK